MRIPLAVGLCLIAIAAAAAAPRAKDQAKPAANTAVSESEHARELPRAHQ